MTLSSICTPSKLGLRKIRDKCKKRITKIYKINTKKNEWKNEKIYFPLFLCLIYIFKGSLKPQVAPENDILSWVFYWECVGWGRVG